MMESAEKAFNTTIINMFKYLTESRNIVRRKKYIFKKNEMESLRGEKYNI